MRAKQIDMFATTKTISLEDLRAANVERQRLWDPDQKITGMFFAVELAGEVGELLNVFKKLLRENLGLPGSRASVKDLEEELADVLIVVDLLAMRMNVDLTRALIEKFNKTSDRLGIEVKL